MSAQTIADDDRAELDRGSQRKALLAMITGLVAVVATMSGLNVARQQMALELGASQGGVLWIINSYTLILAALLLPAGAIGDRFTSGNCTLCTEFT
jgi:MFS family permease